MPSPQVETVPAVARRHLRVKEVADMYGISIRHAYRLADIGKIPFGIKLGKLRKWDSHVINEHIKAGCPVVRQPKRRP